MNKDKTLESLLAERKSEKPEKKKSKITVDEITHCPECNSTRIKRDRKHGETICENCGLVLEENAIDQSGGLNLYTDDPVSMEKQHIGSPSTVLRHDHGLSTEISKANKDAYGKPIPKANRNQMYRLRKWHKRTRIENATGRNISRAFIEIGKYASKLGLPTLVRETAAIIYKKATYARIVKGRSIECVVLASIYSACRQCNVPRTLDEITDNSEVSRKEVGKAYKTIVKTLRLSIVPTTPENYVSRFCNELKLKSETQSKTLEILTLAREKDSINGKCPTGTAAAAIYIASRLCNNTRTQREVANIAGITEVTIRSRYKDLCNKLDISLEGYT